MTVLNLVVCHEEEFNDADEQKSLSGKRHKRLFGSGQGTHAQGTFCLPSKQDGDNRVEW